MATRRQRPAPGLIQHFERGIQYEADHYSRAPAAAKTTTSMGREGNCLDNAPMKGLFQTLNVESAHERIDDIRDEARRDLFV
jgi:transposase InsO family protein